MRSALIIGLFTFCLVGHVVSPLPIRAQNSKKSGCEMEAVTSYDFSKGEKSIQVMAGAFSAPVLTLIFPKTPDLDYHQLDVRFGWMLTDPTDGPSIFSGNYEALLELTNSAVQKGPGNFFSGSNLLLRYNFVHPGTWLVPYVQGSAGLVYNDIYKDKRQEAIGEAIEFMLGLAAGTHVFITRRWSIDVEADYQHISNAGLARRNYGNNAFGALAGISYFF
jgi:hypothetical protein